MLDILKFVIILLNFSILPINSFAQDMDPDKEELQQILSSPPNGFSQEYWSKAVKSYLGSCSSGSCQCLFGVTEKQDTFTGLTWFGSLATGQANSVFFSTGRIEFSRWDGPYNRKLPKCIAGSSWAVPNPSKPGQCCRRSGHKAGLCRPCTAYQSYADFVGMPSTGKMKIIYYASQLSGQILLHDSYGCGGGACPSGTWGCSTIDAHAMKDLCTQYIGQSSGVNVPLISNPTIDTNGVWYFFHGNGNGSEDTALAGLKAVKSKCTNISYSNLGSGPGAGFSSNSSSSSSSGGNSSSSSGSSSESLGSFSNLTMFDQIFNVVSELYSAIQTDKADQAQAEALAKAEEQKQKEEEEEQQHPKPSSNTLLEKDNGAYAKAGGNADHCYIMNGEKICD